MRLLDVHSTCPSFSSNLISKGKDCGSCLWSRGYLCRIAWKGGRSPSSLFSSVYRSHEGIQHGSVLLSFPGQWTLSYAGYNGLIRKGKQRKLFCPFEQAPAWALGHVPRGSRQDKNLWTCLFHFCVELQPLILWIGEGVICYILAEKMKSKATFEGKGVGRCLQGMLPWYSGWNGALKMPACLLPLLVMENANISQSCLCVAAAKWVAGCCLCNSHRGTVLSNGPDVHFEAK